MWIIPETALSGAGVHAERPHGQREQHDQLADVPDVPARHRHVALQRARRDGRVRRHRVQGRGAPALIHEDRQDAE